VLIQAALLGGGASAKCSNESSYQ